MMTCGERGVPAQSHDRVLAPFTSKEPRAIHNDLRLGSSQDYGSTLKGLARVRSRHWVDDARQTLVATGLSLLLGATC